MLKTKDRTIIIGLQLSLLFFAAQLLILLVFWQKLPPRGPLFYSRPWGERQLVKPVNYWLLPLLSFFITLINLFLAVFFTAKEKLTAQLLVIFTAIFNFLCFFTLFKIFNLIT